MTFEIKTAERKKEKIRLGLFGPSGAGKTYSALKVAYGLCGDWSKIVVIDTENRSGVLYSGIDSIGVYHHLEFQPPYAPYRYVEAISACENAGFEVVIIDSISHEWSGPGGCLEIQASLGGKYQDWAKVTPMHQSFLDKIRFSTAHVICCGRQKQDYAMSQNDKGKMEVQKLGMGAITRDGFEYELTVSLDINMKHFASVLETGKDRTGIFDGKPPRQLTEQDGRLIAAWCDSGTEFTEQDRIKALQNQIVEVMRAKNIPPQKAVEISGLETTKGQPVKALEMALSRLMSYVA